ncbi:MAG TPA: hypothetical protein VD969_24240 [Symbiobacteriaceae bacterium]|nr:hypothetical protein [Symbiobacteriaceae bacterium]
MQEIANRLRLLEDRLERLLASGWRNAGAEAADFATEAAALIEAGLPALGERLGRVATVGAGEALGAAAMALAACRLLRARLPADAPLPGNWAPLSKPKQRTAVVDRVVPVCRVPHGGGEAWAGVRLRGMHAEDLVLVAPTGAPRPWLRHVLEGGLRWQERHLLGASGEYQVCTMANPGWADLAAEALLLAPNDPRKEQPVFSGGGGLRLVQVVPDDLNVYAWLHPTMIDAARAALQHSQRAVAWVDGALVAPLAILVPGGLLRRARLVHLVAGAPAEVL